MSLGAPGQLLLQNHLAALSAGIQTSGNAAAAMGLQSPEQLQALQQALTQQHHTLQQQLQQFVLFQPGASATGSPAQAQFFLQNQVRPSFYLIKNRFEVSVLRFGGGLFWRFLVCWWRLHWCVWHFQGLVPHQSYSTQQPIHPHRNQNHAKAMQVNLALDGWIDIDFPLLYFS